MRVVFDTNVIIDAIAGRKPFDTEAKKLLLLAAKDEFKGYITANSVTDIYYVVRRSLTEDETRLIIKSVLYSLDIIGVSDEDCRQAFNSTIRDYEDALLATCAEKIDADSIVSRDAEFLKSDSSVPVCSPLELLQKLSAEDCLD